MVSNYFNVYAAFPKIYDIFAGRRFAQVLAKFHFGMSHR